MVRPQSSAVGSACIGALLLAASGCYQGLGADGADELDGPTRTTMEGGDSDGEPVGDAPTSGVTGLRLLTPTQYRNSVADVLGLADAEAVGQWRSSIAAAQGGVSAASVEDYEQAALEISTTVFGDDLTREQLTGCVPAAGAPPDDPCVSSVIETLGRRAWRRPLSSDEIVRYAEVASEVADLLEGDAWQGLGHAVAGLLQSPHFLYRVEIGQPVGGDTDRVRLDGYEVASRLSYLVWNTTPDDALLDAAERGELDDPEGLAAQVDRLLSSPRARDGVVQVFVDMLDLDALHSLQKDAALLPRFTPTIGPAMREELVRVIEDTVLDQGDYRRLFDTTQGFVNAELAAHYGIEGELPVDDFVPVDLPAGRAGLLSLGGFLAINSGEASTSPTKRGLTVRTVLMCQSIPPPPPDVEADLPEPGEGEGPMTKREQLERHREDPACSSCHDFMDPIGLALENFDALGGYRTLDQGLPIDPSGELDGDYFADSVQLGVRLTERPAIATCMTRNLYRYAVGHVEQEDEAELLGAVKDAFEASGYDLRVAVQTLVTHDAFRLGVLPPEGP